MSVKPRKEWKILSISITKIGTKKGWINFSIINDKNKIVGYIYDPFASELYELPDDIPVETRLRITEQSGIKNIRASINRLLRKRMIPF